MLAFVRICMTRKMYDATPTDLKVTKGEKHDYTNGCQSPKYVQITKQKSDIHLQR